MNSNMIVTEAEIREEAIKRIKILIDRFNRGEIGGLNDKQQDK